MDDRAPTKRILIIEDDETMREMIRYNLERAGFDVTSTGSGKEGSRMARVDRPDLVVLDLKLPETDGMTVCREIRSSGREIPIIMLTALASDKDRLDGFGAGADDYVTKPFSMEELVARIKANVRRASRGLAASPAESLAYGDLTIYPEEQRATVNGADLTLRSKEWALLLLLSSSPGKLFSRQEIAERIWGYEYLSDSRTIDVHVKNLRQRLAASSFEFLETVRGSGYRFKPHPRIDR